MQKIEISIKQLETCGIGVIRGSFIKNTIKGRIYNATVYYKDAPVEVKVLNKHNGETIIIGPSKQSKETDFINFVTDVLPILPKPNYLLRKVLRTAILISAAVTLINILTITSRTDAVYIGIDTIALTVLAILYTHERKVYELQ